MYNKFTLDNGLRVVCESIPHVRSVATGIWVGAGSRNENPEINGISHFIEHMFFKGTHRHSAKNIADIMDGIGGQINAFTGKECTCYYTKTLDTHIETAFDILSDMLFNSKFASRDISVEKNVILEEIHMYEDSPEELVHDILSETAYSGNSLGYPIIGTKDSVMSFDKRKASEYIKRYYTPKNCVLSVAGNITNERLAELAEKYFGKWKNDGHEGNGDITAIFRQNTRIKEKDTEQTHICLGFNGLEQGDERLYALLAINNIFGGGMSSRLFQKIREKLGLVYSIYSYPSAYKNAGLFAVYAGMKPEHADKVGRLVIKEIKGMLGKGIEEDEVKKSKEQLKGSFILGLESTSSRMTSIGKSELMLGKISTTEEVLEKIDAITLKDVKNIAEMIFDVNMMSVSAVGNIKTINFMD